MTKTTMTPGRLTLILILGSLAALGPLSIDMYLPAFPDMSRSFDASASLIQLSLTACMLGMALGQLIVGPFSDVRGRKRPLMIALLAYLLASLACAMAPTIEVLIALRFIQGAAGASGIVISRAIVRDLFEGPELTRFFAALSLVNGTAPILAPVIGGQLLRFGDWHFVFYLLAILSTLMLLAVALRLPETLPLERRVEGNLTTTLKTFGRLLTDRVFIGYAFAQAFVMGAMFAYISGSPFVLQNIYGASPQQFSFLFGLNGIGIILAAQIAGRLAGRVDSERLMRISLTVVASAS
ncbi:multidrug effflux MFS transporter, partial [Exiguobacterium sp.]